MARLATIFEEALVAGNGTIAKNLPKGAYSVMAFDTASDNASWQLCPRLVYAAWDNDGTFTDHTAIVTERGTIREADITALHQTEDKYYIGADVPFRGFYLDLENKNDTASTLTVNYRKDDNTWADLSQTDGTDSSGDTLKVSGDNFWTMPTDWTTYTVNSVGPLYFVQLVVSATIDSTSINEIVLLSVSSSEAVAGPEPIARAEPGVGFMDFDTDAVGGVEVTGDAASDEVSFRYKCARTTNAVVGL